ncbi:thiol-disulfide oxidoreductase DCC family protein [Cohnella suwonensis]|uniref:Thiol-disulfide oxidoreductase DCC family protein n=1 Tax=Cohnella suwonensis TaxID=696072 RepID=A0ABW0M3V6_9BACL
MKPDNESKSVIERSVGSDGKSIVLIDGVCHFCHGAAKFIIARDPKARFRFASLQSVTGESLLGEGGLSSTSMDTFVLIENGKFYTKSTAALRIARRLAGGWPLLYAGIVVPKFARDAIYGFVAKRRYKWFGREDSCMLPTPDVRGRFL